MIRNIGLADLGRSGRVDVSSHPCEGAPIPVAGLILVLHDAHRGIGMRRAPRRRSRSTLPPVTAESGDPPQRWIAGQRRTTREFDELYVEGTPPWDIGRPQPALQA